MRKDIKKKENTFNLLIIILFIFSSTNILQLVFFKDFRNSKNIVNVEEKTTRILQYNLAIENNIDGKNFNNMDMVKVITENYLKNQSFEVGDCSEEEAKKVILENKLFRENGSFSKKKFLEFLKKMSIHMNLNINTYDFIMFTINNLRTNFFKDLQSIYLKEATYNETFKKSIEFNKRKVIKGYKIHIPLESLNIKIPEFSSKEINKFIFEEKLKKNIHYTIPEKRSGYIIKVKLSGVSQTIIKAIDYFLKHREFNEEKLKKFLITYGIHTENFVKILNVEHKNILEISNNIDVNSQEYKNFKLEKFVTINVYSNVILNEDTKLLFKKEFNKTFVLIGDEYGKVNITDIEKSKNVEITKDFRKNFLLPSMEAVYMHDYQLKTYYDLVINHNCKKINLLNENYNKISIEITDENHEYFFVCYGSKNDGIILHDIHSNPFIFIIEDIYFIDNQIYNISEKKFNDFIDDQFAHFIRKDIFTIIFKLAYNKLTTSVAH